MSRILSANRIQKYLVIAIILLFVGCGGKDQLANDSNGKNADSITVSAAISLKDAFTEIGEMYTARSGNGAKIQFNFGASGVLQQQIENGAPVDVFASAGERQMDALAAKGLLEPGSRYDLARNSLVLIVPQNSEVAVSSFADLALPTVKKIAVGNPKTVPAGQYSNEALTKMGLAERVGGKLILAENVRQVLEYVVRGEVDAGIVYSTDAKQGGAKVNVAATADENAHSPILYPIAAVKEGAHQRAAQEFIALVLSVDGQKVLAKYGFSPVKGSNSNQ
ncbi:MAG TPA: molybdate ABC transporter substrate-binding protein [Pyrinomonadaceae bacterium]|nr:molybdate ABC transporter substrate-binding protein [Pyrinomonadaceae bacterium]